MHSLMNARQEMFDNVYWHHTNRACMAMLLRAVQDAIDAGLSPRSLSSLRRRNTCCNGLREPEMPESTRKLVDGLRSATMHKRPVEISSRAGPLQLSQRVVFAPCPQTGTREIAWRAYIEGERLKIERGDVLIDIPKPEKWRSTLWIHYARSTGRPEPDDVVA